MPSRLVAGLVSVTASDTKLALVVVATTSLALASSDSDMITAAMALS